MQRTWVTLTLLAALSTAALAQGTPSTPSSGRPPVVQAQSSRPTWSELSPAQREALAPLQGEWNRLESDRKQKWLEVAAKYPRMSPEGQKRLHERMQEFVKLTPEQRRTARENFKRAYELPADQREALIEQYNALPPEKKQELANQAGRRADTPRRTPRDARAESDKGGRASTAKPVSSSSKTPAGGSVVAPPPAAAPPAGTN